MEKCWFHLMLFNKKLEHRYVLSKSKDSIDADALGHTSGSEEPFLNDVEKKIPSWGSYSLSNIHYLNSFFDSRNTWSLISDYTFLVINSNGDSYSVYFDIENQIFDMDNASSFLSELDIFFSFLKNKNNKSGNLYYYNSMDETQSNQNNPIYSFIETYLRFEIEICLNNDIYSGIENYITNFICAESISSIEGENLSIKISSSSFNRRVISNNFDINTNNFDINTKLWVQCENCYETNYKKFFRSKMNICEHCGYHLNMSSSDRNELFIDPDTWEPMDEDMVSMDPIEIHSEEEPYRRVLEGLLIVI
ncbi:hypothetical protein KSP40_PGU002209 [Platanthera guangdongensis]|uniref:Acetyl-coA carboxylase beta subunit n=1 Tax=Platanthera guangdongensis TaxID=2320717 RepID=A0ABR2LG27_9ASPA